jgi:ketosteroid isomerase-like protein
MPQISGGGGTMTRDERAVVAAVQEMTAAFQDGAIDRVMSCYESGAAVAFEPGKPVTDPAVIRRTFVEWCALAPQFEYGGHDVMAMGDLAVHIAPWHMRGTTPDRLPVEQRGLSVAVLRRSGGAWRLVLDNPHGHRLLEGR